MGWADYDFVDSHNKRRRVDLIFTTGGRHRCTAAEIGECSQHRVVFGDLLPIEQYRNGNIGRHHSPDDVPDTTEAHHI